jgi:hypothetical protein
LKRAFRLARFAAAASLCVLANVVMAQVPAQEPLQRASAALRLPVLAERMAKLHAQIGQGILAQRSRRALAETARDFDSTLRTAAAAAPTAQARENYVLLSLLWHEYRDWAQRAPTRENARKLRERAEEVVWVASKGARMFQEHSRAGLSGSVVRAEQAALLSQRIPKLYLWRRWDIRDDAAAKELREAQENLRRSLEALRTAPDNTPEIEAELQVADNQLRFMDDAARQLDVRHDSRHLEFIAKAGDHILESMERAARLYVAARP